jgi:hypothetical protein
MAILKQPKTASFSKDTRKQIEAKLETLFSSDKASLSVKKFKKR